jgi:hypothetical protein
MNTEFFTMQMTREELLELHASVVQRAMLEDDIRREKGLEPISRQPLLEKLDALLGLTDAQEDRISRELDDELWEHAWFAFTDEWAWYRAMQAVEQELGAERLTLDSERLRERIERRYQKDFERFVKEIEMGPEPKQA